jgi:hypothetical protein
MWVLGLAIVLSLATLGCSPIAKVFGRPLPELVGATARESFGLDYQVNVDCTVKNRGAAGNVTVAAELNLGGFWRKEQEEFIPEGDTQLVTIAFSEPRLLSGGLSSGSYKCDV